MTPPKTSCMCMADVVKTLFSARRTNQPRDESLSHLQPSSRPCPLACAEYLATPTGNLACSHNKAGAGNTIMHAMLQSQCDRWEISKLSCAPSVPQPCDSPICEGFHIRDLIIFNPWSIIAGTWFTKSERDWGINIIKKVCWSMLTNKHYSYIVE